MDPQRTSRRGIAGLTPRIVVIAALSASLGLGVMYLALTRIISGRVFGLASDTIVEVMRLQGGLGCAQDPEHWGFVLGDKTRIDAFDIDTLRSRNPGAPALEPELAGLVRAGATRVYPSPVFAGQGAVLLVKVAEHGPCSLVRLHRQADPGLTREGVLLLSSFLLFALVLTGVLGMLWVVRPLLRRIGVLARVAGSVGTPDVFPAMQPSRDELGEIERGLLHAHDRITSSQAELTAKNLALTGHLADVAHDLLTPISSLQLALERLASGDADVRAEALAAAIGDAVYLEHLTDNLRLATKLAEGLVGDAAMQRTDLVQVILRVCGRFALLARQKRIALERAHPDEAVWLVGDPVLHERALSNLVHNALRYGEVGGHVAVLLEVQGTRFTLAVLDDGPGVPPEDIGRLAERTFRSDQARQRDVHGQGLGLAITSEICRRADLQLAFSAVEPRGLRVCISGSTALEPAP
ncbi:MAG: HAMP domain-containing sensor histidine kinase [Pseudomonadota bacterium]